MPNRHPPALSRRIAGTAAVADDALDALLPQGVVPERGDVPVVGGWGGLDRRPDIGEELQEEGAALGVRQASAVTDRRVWVLQNVPADVGGRVARARARVVDDAARDCAAAKSSRPSRQITASPSKTVPGLSVMPTTARSIQCWVTTLPDRAYSTTVSSARRSTVLWPSFSRLRCVS
ncbi:hypothetical protein OOK13_40670 [Streptomyces sp. NBC_00378]|uniref:hypothetical protein n=1 Tax=unclassified Streptomyces TaxID=2593676 RepID=UPI00225050A5|nr:MULTISPECIES: hypothetical protein [unclassified Streptomyces]MCX5114674.1 hypothetical protein [Streptomyces sp. NBC_00378]